ncbi:MAG: hypothetical protein OEW75_12525 [Cyclobacteriaceae bacterium]|nr:hypothetical protein [Cyclobacteriaceae bacterium]
MEDENSFGSPENISPSIDTFKVKKGRIDYKVPAYSMVVLKLGMK